MASDDVRELSYEDLKSYTDGFSEKNLIGKVQFGKVYRGRIGEQEVTVKIWEDPLIYYYCPEVTELRFKDEITVLKHLDSHSNLVKLIGFCGEDEKLGVVYDLKPVDTVHNLMFHDESKFSWLQRIKVALKFALLLEYLHMDSAVRPQYIICNIDAAHIMLDKDCNPKLFDFSMITGGVLVPDRKFRKHRYWNGCYGYIDLDHAQLGIRTELMDVFAFGVILLGLISRRVFTEEEMERYGPHVFDWARSSFKEKKSKLIRPKPVSLVHNSLEPGFGFYSSDGIQITKLAMQCVEKRRYDRPTMKQVVNHLLHLRIVQRHAVL